MREHAPVALAGLDDVEHAVRLRGEHEAVRHHLDGRAVEYDKVVLLPEALQQLVHALRAEQLGGVRRDAAGGQDVDGLLVLIRVQRLLFQARIHQDVAQAAFGADIQQARDLRAAQVAVDDQDAVLHVREAHGEVDGGDALALALHAGDDHDHTAVRLSGEGEDHVRAQRLIGLAQEEIVVQPEQVFAILQKLVQFERVVLLLFALAHLLCPLSMGVFSCSTALP
jgi:hypothetical protein